MSRSGDDHGLKSWVDARHARRDPGVLLIELSGYGERRHGETFQLFPQRRLAPRPHPPQRPRKLARIVAPPRLDGPTEQVLVPRQRREERLTVPVPKERLEISRFQALRLRLISSAARGPLTGALQAGRGRFEEEPRAPFRGNAAPDTRPAARPSSNRPLRDADLEPVQGPDHSPCGALDSVRIRRHVPAMRRAPADPRRCRRLGLPSPPLPPASRRKNP